MEIKINNKILKLDENDIIFSNGNIHKIMTKMYLGDCYPYQIKIKDILFNFLIENNIIIIVDNDFKNKLIDKYNEVGVYYILNKEFIDSIFEIK